MGPSLEKQIESIMKKVRDYQKEAGRSEKGRMWAIVNTHLETAKLYAKEIKTIE